VNFLPIQPRSGDLFVALGRATKEWNPGYKNRSTKPSATRNPKKRELAFQTEGADLERSRKYKGKGSEMFIRTNISNPSNILNISNHLMQFMHYQA
jgi:hypothetical protein